MAARDPGGHSWSVCKVMLPDAKHFPACPGEGALDPRVSLPIATQFGEPIFAVAPGFPAVFRAAMPEATINEDCKALAAENEIGASQKRLVAPPPSEATDAQNVSELLLVSLLPLERMAAITRLRFAFVNTSATGKLREKGEVLKA